MATALQILQSTFGVKTIAPTDPGIQKLAEIRSGVYEGIGQVNISPTSEAAQLLGLQPDPLKNYDPRTNEFLDKTLPAVLAVGVGTAAGYGVSGIVGDILKTGITTAYQGSIAPAPQPQTGGRMAFADGDSGYFGIGDVFGGINQVLQGGLGRDLLNAAGNFGVQYLTSQQGTGRVPITMADTLPAVGGAGRAVAIVGRSFFNRFPNLATGIQALRNMGKNVTRANLYSLMKRFGPDFLITGGILTAAAVSELAMAGPGRRRMNPGNIKALRRAHRRMKSFHHVCQTNDTLLTHRRRATRRSNFSGTSITQVK
jgi:hypothetical protein